MDGTTVVELDDAVAVLGGYPALAGVDAVRSTPGEIVLLRGPNGAGKTTLLRVCAGLLPLRRGTGRVLGCDLATDARGLRRRVGLLGHRNGLYLDLSVAENVRFWGATIGATPTEVDAAMERLGLAGRLAGLPVRRLSAGQQRRTALACLVARRARLWLLDEPHAGLDAAGRDELDTTLRQAAASGATVVVASHELERAGSLATRCIDVVAGQVVGRERAAVSTVRTALLVAGKDLRIEWRSRVGLNQVLPFAAIVMVMFAFALDRLPAVAGSSGSLLESVAPGLVWLATLFSLLLLVQRTFAVESEDGALDALRAAGVDAAAVFWGKSLALAVQLAVLEALLLLTAVLLYGSELRWSGRRPARRDLDRRDRRTGRGRYALRRPRCRRTGAGDPPPAAAAPGGGARSDRSNPSGRSSARHRRDGGRGRLALGRRGRGVRRRLRCRGNAGLRSAHRRVGGTLETVRPATTSTRATRLLGTAALIGVAWLVAFGLGFSPADVNQRESVRILYVHVPSAWLAYLAFVVTAVASGIYLFGRRHSLGWDRLAGASAEIGVLFMGITLVTGMLWGRLTWGVFWEWDARLTTTAFLFVTYIGYLAVRRLGGSHEQRAPAQRRARPPRRAGDPARALERAAVAQPAPGADGAATRRRRRARRPDAVHAVRRGHRLHPAVRLAGDPSPADDGRRGRPRGRRARPGDRSPPGGGVVSERSERTIRHGLFAHWCLVGSDGATTSLDDRVHQ